MSYSKVKGTFNFIYVQLNEINIITNSEKVFRSVVWFLFWISQMWNSLWIHIHSFHLFSVPCCCFGFWILFLLVFIFKRATARQMIYLQTLAFGQFSVKSFFFLFFVFGRFKLCALHNKMLDIIWTEFCSQLKNTQICWKCHWPLSKQPFLWSEVYCLLVLILIFEFEFKENNKSNGIVQWFYRIVWFYNWPSLTFFCCSFMHVSREVISKTDHHKTAYVNKQTNFDQRQSWESLLSCLGWTIHMFSSSWMVPYDIMFAVNIFFDILEFFINIEFNNFKFIFIVFDFLQKLLDFHVKCQLNIM